MQTGLAKWVEATANTCTECGAALTRTHTHYLVRTSMQQQTQSSEPAWTWQRDHLLDRSLVCSRTGSRAAGKGGKGHAAKGRCHQCTAPLTPSLPFTHAAVLKHKCSRELQPASFFGIHISSKSSRTLPNSACKTRIGLGGSCLF